ncbi:transketolase [Pseudomonadales bacterium]|nr:transketolase [Pseudomonadales bacterium]MDB4567195.1 transketolase [Pseudomonadales bacterium]MDC1314907.1 transketolase [Pseudomonadales bacterium]
MSTSRARANAIRALAMDAVQAAKSGHPGAPMGMADMAEVLWGQFLKHNPGNPNWWNRDRFVLSNGHGSMLIYSLLHLTGYDVSLDDLKAFRQLGSKTPGHPELGYTPGVETTTGPLGQGLANAVGLALAEKSLASTFNQVGADGQTLDIIDHHTYVFAGDGCLMEGVSHEACSLAGTLGLGKLICLYDDNGISIDGPVTGWFTDDTAARFEAYGWQVMRAVDGHDADAVSQALREAKANLSQPTLICCKTTIGFGSPNKGGTAGSHGSPLGDDEIALTRAALDWSHAPFVIPEALKNDWDALESGAAAEAGWQQTFAAYTEAFPELAQDLTRRMQGELPAIWPEAMATLRRDAQAAGKVLASRQASGEVIAQLSALLPELLGGSADLSGSNNTNWPAAAPITAEDASGNYVYYGVREFGMTAIANGLALHGGLIPFTGTFLMFMEYARNAVRMSALMGLQNIHVYTHDSIGQGEDGPTHQPVEQLTNLRTTPNLQVWRPCDTVETVSAWQAAIERRAGPTALVFSRQNLAHQDRDADQLSAIDQGGYILFEPASTPVAILIATGSEVEIARQAALTLTAGGQPTRLVSMPCAEVFAVQPDHYQQQVLPKDSRVRVAVEAGHGDYWRKWVGLDGAVVSLDRFGESGPGPDVLAHFGFSAEHIVATVKELL